MKNASLLAAVIVVTLVTMAAVLLNESGMIHAVQLTLERITR